MCEDPGPSGLSAQPVSNVRWMQRDRLVPNDYNPNHVAPPEFRLIKKSILEDGWTAPIVAYEQQAGPFVIIDGENRWRVSEDPDVFALTNGRVPVVVLRGTIYDRMISTIRHNRARGEHGVLPMAKIVGALLSDMPQATIEERLQMESEEVERLAEKEGLPAVVTRDKSEFSKGWVPGHE